jgi:hypothetical protein
MSFYAESVDERDFLESTLSVQVLEFPAGWPASGAAVESDGACSCIVAVL